jgi:hypothetical protein
MEKGPVQKTKRRIKVTDRAKKCYKEMYRNARTEASMASAIRTRTKLL